MKIGVRIKIDVTKIEKDRLFRGQKGTYLDATTFINIDDQDQYGNNGFISQDVTKEDRDNGIQGNILGNAKVFYRDDDNHREPQPKQPTHNEYIPF